MIDIAVSYNRYKFLGNEFLTWLWFSIENEVDLLKGTDSDPVIVKIGNRIVLENILTDDSTETITIKGDDAGLEEGITALGKGALVTELNISLRTGDSEWKFNLKGESLNFTSFKTPETSAAEKKEELEGAILEKIYLCESAIEKMDLIYKQFIRLRISSDWREKTIPSIKRWIKPSS